ncbi:MAG: nucleotidyltransferase domain-containing protein, partial [Terriglobales bacterium]
MFTDPTAPYLDQAMRNFYCHAMKELNDHHVDFLVGGAYGLAQYTGIQRHTKDFDIFVRRRDCQRAMKVLADAGYRTELTFPHWLGK